MKKKKKTKSAIPRKHRMEEPVWRSEAPKKCSSKFYYYDKRYYFNLKSRRWKRHIDGTWDNGPIISRVPLYPEQAVLSCCSAVYGINDPVRFDQGVTFIVCVTSDYIGGQVCDVSHGNKGAACVSQTGVAPAGFSLISS